MAPEQLEGREADARTDIFAFGCVLYEMATGGRRSPATSQASLISAIMTRRARADLPMQPMTPPALDRVVKTCLARTPRTAGSRRTTSASELRWIAEGSAAGVTATAAVVAPPSLPRPARLGCSPRRAVLCRGWLGLSLRRAARGAGRARLRTNLLLPERVAAHTSPSSRRTDAASSSSGRGRRRPRPAVDAVARFLLLRADPGDRRGIFPFWSPDGRFIGFFADKKLKRIEATGGSPIDLREADGVGGAWAPNGDILFEVASGPISRGSTRPGGSPYPSRGSTPGVTRRPTDIRSSSRMDTTSSISR